LVSDGFQSIAERTIILQSKTSDARRKVVVQLGKPYWVSEGIEAACSVVVLGDDRWPSRNIMIRGDDLLQCLELSIKFIHSILDDFAASNRVLFEDGSEMRESL